MHMRVGRFNSRENETPFTNSIAEKDMVIRHSIPGRMRIKVSLIRFLEGRANHLQVWLSERKEVVSVEARSSTGSVILVYNPENIGSRAVLKLATEGLRFALSVPETSVAPQPASCAAECDVCRPGEPAMERTFTARIAEVVALTCFMLYALVREILFKAPLAQGPISLVALVAVVAAIPLLRHAWQDMRQGRFASLFPFLAATCVLAIFTGEALTALEVIWILRLGLLLEDYVADKSRKAIRAILELAEKNTFIWINGVEVEIPVDRIQVGDIVVAHTGEKIAVDGTIVRGEAMVDEAHITGRSEPELRKRGHPVFAGAIVQRGVIFIRTEKVGDDTYLCRILYLVENSLANRAPVEKHADILAARLMALGAGATVATLMLTGSLLRSFTVMLVMACPCATVLASSTAITAAIANAARNHILVKGGLYLETIGKADCFCFDKTGTLTTDTPEVIEVVPLPPKRTVRHVLELAAAAEIHNEHPMAKSIVEAANIRGIVPEHHAVCEFVLGRGVRAELHGDTILVGNQQFMAEESINTSYFRDRAADAAEGGNTALYVAKNGRVYGMITVANSSRPRAGEVLRWLRSDGVDTIHMVTGDTEAMAKSMAVSLGFDDYRAGLLPEDKGQYVTKLQTNGKRLVMVGDGVNDSLALSRAHVGIAMGAGGADVAIESADIALVDSDLERIVRLRQLSHQTIRIVEQNYLLAISTNVVGAFLGAAGLLSPVMGGLLHIAHTLGILLNSNRLETWEAPGLPDESTESGKEIA
ncbi:MAG: heavy metal translocating P-type ATPase [Pseudomonadota bacterium]